MEINAVLLKYGEIFYNSPAAMLIIAPDAPAYTMLDVNQAYLQATHTAREELIGNSVFDVFPGNPDDEVSKNIERTIFSFEQAIKNKRQHIMHSYRYDIPIPGTDQFEERYWTTSNTPVMNENAEVIYFIHSPENVTELYKLTQKEKQNVEAMQLQQQQLYSIFMQAPVGIGIFKGPQYIVDLVNPPLCELFGRTMDELINRPIFDVLTDARGQGFEQLLEGVRTTGVPFKGMGIPASLMRNGQLETLYINFVYEPFRDIDGSIIGVISVATEVSELMEAKEQLEDAEERIRLAIDAMQLGTFDFDLITNEMVTNKQFTSIFGFDEPVPLSKYTEVFHPDDMEIRAQAHKEALHTGKLVYEARIIWKDESIHWIRIEGKVFYSEEIKPVRILGTLLDITEQKSLQRQKDDFIAIASHELKTPVTTIKGYAQVLEMMLDKKGDSKEAAMMRRMDLQINRLTSLIGDLLDVTKINTGKLRFNDTEFDFNEMVKELVEDMQRTITTHTIIEDYNYTGTVYGDKERINQVIVNLITNAIKYSPQSNNIIIHTLIENNEVVLCVEDFGIGIPENKLEKVFEQFYRVSGNKQHTFPGLGLGLYISSEIMKREGGRIWVTSTLGKGSSFCLAMPINKNKEPS